MEEPDGQGPFRRCLLILGGEDLLTSKRPSLVCSGLDGDSSLASSLDLMFHVFLSRFLLVSVKDLDQMCI